MPSERGMTARYLIALGLVAALSCAAYISLRREIVSQRSVAAIVNYSGKRRFSAQRRALFCLELATSAYERARDLARAKRSPNTGVPR